VSTSITLYTIACCMLLLLQTNSIYGQGGWKWSSQLNSASGNDAAGTSNDFPFNIRVNNIPKGSFTNSGLDVFGSFHSINAYVDSVLTVWDALISHSLSIGGNLSMNGIATITGSLTIGQKFFFDPVTEKFTSSSGTINIDGNDLKTTGTFQPNILRQKLLN